jgi:hypothetical protein
MGCHRQIRLFEGEGTKQVENLVNDFIINSGKEVLDIKHSSNPDKCSVLVIYREWNANG